MKFMSATFSYYSSPLVIIVPHGQPVTPLERLLKPFQKEVWIFVLLVFALAATVIAFTKLKCSEAQQHFVLGTENSTPFFNLFVVFVGNSLSKLPTRNFSRTLLCIFMLYSLIIRNSYTGALFDFIKNNNVHKPSIDSIDKMIELNFTFYMITSAGQLTAEIPKLYERRHLISPGDVPVIREKMTNSSFQAGLLSSLEQVVYFNMINQKNFVVNVCPEPLYTFHYAIHLQKNSPFLHNFDLKIADLQTAGFVNYLVNKYVQFSFMKNKNYKNSPKALEKHQLNGSFELLYFGLIFSFAVFILEYLSVRVRSFFNL